MHLGRPQSCKLCHPLKETIELRLDWTRNDATDPRATKTVYDWLMDYQKEQSMKQSVTVNGITLSRAQAEDALKTLNAPEPRIENLTHVEGKSSHQKGIVLVGNVQQAYVRGKNAQHGAFLVGRYTVVAASGFGSTYETVEALLKDWAVMS